MSDLIERLRNLNQHGFIKYDDLFIGNDAADEIERLTKLSRQKNADEELKEIDRLNHIITLLCMSNQSLQAELAAVKAQSTEPVAVIKRNESGQITMQAPDGNHFDMSKYVGATLYTTPPTATELLESLGDWVYEKMQQADADYHDHGDDTAEVYATLKMVLSKIESMIESLPLINDFNQGETK